VNLKNKSYCILNEQYTKEEYFEKLKEFDLSSIEKVHAFRERFEKHMLQYPRRFARMVHVTNSTGDNLEETKNCKYCFDVFGGAEDCINVWLAYSKVRDTMDVDRVGKNSELGYECSALYPGSRVLFSRFTFDAHDISHSYNTYTSSNLFGCVGMRNKHYCILNKQYTPEEYETMKMRIIEHMDAMPYVDKKGRVYKYGEFFPAEISPFAYNETIAQEMFPLTAEKAIEEGYVWKKSEERHYQFTKTSADFPHTIAEVSDSIVDEVIQCAHKGTCAEQCTEAFKIVQAELQFYRQMNIPLPRLCPSCRHCARVRQRNPVKLWKRKCQCVGAYSSKEEGVGNKGGPYKNTAAHFHGAEKCPNEFETSYSPDRPEIVYCEQCYQSEVA